MIDLIYKTLQTIINKEQNGYISPTEFNILANNVQFEIFRNYFEDENLDKIKKNKGLTNKGYSNLDFNARQRISAFSEIVVVSKISDVFTMPEDFYFLEDDGIINNTLNHVLKNTVEEIERGSINYLNNSISKPTEVYPVYENYGKHIKVYPSTIDSIEVRYVRTPKMPTWTYFVLGTGQEVFDPSNSSYQDFELHVSEFTNIVNRMLTYFGINLREEEIVQIAETLKDKLTIKDSQ